MMYKKLALTAALALLLCGCSAQNTESTAEPAETAAVTEAEGAAYQAVPETAAEEVIAAPDAAAAADAVTQAAAPLD